MEVEREKEKDRINNHLPLTPHWGIYNKNQQQNVLLFRSNIFNSYIEKYFISYSCIHQTFIKLLRPLGHPDTHLLNFCYRQALR
jgi:hypothetical protein